MENEIISAKALREKYDKRENLSIQDIENFLIQEAEKGKYFIKINTTDYRIDKDIVKQLKKLGYRIFSIDDTLIIEWNR